MKVLTPALLVALAAPLYGQFFAPELEPLAAKRKADMDAFAAQKAVAMTRAQQPYLSALDSAERAATSSGALDGVAAVTREREALKKGEMPAVVPGDLPKALQAPRKACLDAMERVDTELAPRQKSIDGDYLRSLAALEAKSAGKTDVLRQIAVEKEKVLANIEVGKRIEALLTSKEWIHAGQYPYKFLRGGKFLQGDRKGRYLIDEKKAIVSFFWDDKNHPGEGLRFIKATQTFEHNKGGDFVPLNK